MVERSLWFFLNTKIWEDNVIRFVQLGLISLLLAGCASWKSQEPQSMISRKISSQDFHSMSAIDRLHEVGEHIRITRTSMPALGNPRYYIYEYFEDRAQRVIDRLKQGKDPSLQERTFVPKSLSIAGEIAGLVEAFDAMTKAGIYINYSVLVNPDPEEFNDNFVALNRVINFYRDDLERKFGNQLTPEKRDAVEAREKLVLMKYLVNRIENHYEAFIQGKWNKRQVKYTIERIRKTSFKDLKKFKRDMKRLRKKGYFKHTRHLLSDLDLPDSGDINGSDDAYEQVMSVQLSMGIIDFMSQNI